MTTDCTTEKTPDPADQPKAPGDKCELPDDTGTKPPTLDDPKYPSEPTCKCNCPGSVSTVPNCFNDLIAEQNNRIAQADAAKAAKTELEGLLAKATAASLEYTQDKYKDLLKTWQEQDDALAELARKLTCSVKCWRCVIECYLCPLFKEIYEAEWQLYGKRALYTSLDTIQDKLYWQQRDYFYKTEKFGRVQRVLGVWDSPAKNIEKVLTDNGKAIVDLGKTLVPDGAKAVFDVIVKLIPRHLAIAPPVDASKPSLTTKIDKKYTDFCDFDKSTTTDTCCGPDVGVWTIRQRLVGPVPYLIEPTDYFKVICCLAKDRYLPSKNAMADAAAAVQATENEIKRLKATVDNGLKSFEGNGSARGRIPATVRCCGDEIADPFSTNPVEQTAR